MATMTIAMTNPPAAAPTAMNSAGVAAARLAIGGVCDADAVADLLEANEGVIIDIIPQVGVGRGQLMQLFPPLLPPLPLPLPLPLPPEPTGSSLQETIRVLLLTVSIVSIMLV